MNASVRHFLRLSRKAHVLAATIVFSMAASIAMAQPAGIKLNDQLTVPQWVLPEVPGELSGRLVLPSMNGVIELIANADLVMVNGLGESVQARTNGNGEFRFIGVRPGVYALSAAANGVAACCAMHILPADMESADKYPRSVEISAATIDAVELREMIVRYMPPVTEPMPVRISDVNLAGISSRVIGVDNFRVLQSDGGFKGRLHRAGATAGSLNDAALMNVFLMRGGELLGRSVSDQRGGFAFENVPPGDYSIVALGPDGLGIAGFELVGRDSLTASNRTGNNGETLTAAANLLELNSEFAFQVAPLPQAVESYEIVSPPEEEEEVVVGPPIAGDLGFGPFGGGFGGGGGGFGGGGGGFGGGGGGFGLGGLGALGALAGLAGSDGGSSGGNALFPPQPATPSVPDSDSD